MDYQEYKKEFLTELRNESAISGSDTEDEFVGRTLDILSEFDEIEEPVRIGMGDKKGRGGRLMRADGYAFDETDHSLILLISDFQDSYSPENLNMSRVDELYWRLYYFLDESCNGSLNDYFDDSDDVLKIGRLIKNRINAADDDEERILKVKFFILTNKDLGTNLLEANLLETNVRKSKGRTKKTTKATKKIKKQDFNGKPLEINLWHLERFYEMEISNSSEPIVIDIAHDFPDLNYTGIPCIKGNVGEGLGYDAYIAIIPGKLLASIYIEHGSKVLEGNVRAFLGTGGSKSVNSGIRKTINTDPTKFFTYNNGIAVTAADPKNATVVYPKYKTAIYVVGCEYQGDSIEGLCEQRYWQRHSDQMFTRAKQCCNEALNMGWNAIFVKNSELSEIRQDQTLPWIVDCLKESEKNEMQGGLIYCG